MSHGPTETGGDFLPPIADDLGDGLAEDLRARVKAELEPGERLLWAGRSTPRPAPIAVAFFLWGAIALLVFFLGTLALISGLNRSRWSDDGNPAILGLVLDSASGIIIISMIAHRVSKRSQRIRQSLVCYAITDRRAISWTPQEQGGGVRVRSIHRGRFRDVIRVEWPDGSGDLEFTDPPREIDNPWNKEQFLSIPEVRRAEQIVRNYLIAPTETA